MELINDYDIEDYKYDFNNHGIIYTNLFLNDMDINQVFKQDYIKLLKNKSHYLRFFCKQYGPDSRAYLLTYIRDINRMIPEHFQIVEKFLVTSILTEYKKSNQFLIEINYATMAHFLIYDITTNITIQLD
jgi:hypothetical protein